MYDNYKGIYYDQHSDTKYIDPVNGAHFEFHDMYKRLASIKELRDNEIAAITPAEPDKSRNTVVKQSISSIKPNSILIIADCRKKHQSQVSTGNKKISSKSFALANSIKIDQSKHVAVTQNIPCKDKRNAYFHNKKLQVADQ